MTDDSTEPMPRDIELTIPEMMEYAVRLHRDSRLDAAQSCYRAVLQVEPKNANALHYLGVVHQQRGEKIKAIELVRQSLAIDASVAAWHNNLGNLLLDDGQFDAASAAYTRCSELDLENVEVLNNLGVLLRRLGRYGEAEASLKRALALKPQFASAHANLSTLYCQIPGRIKEAFSHLADALVASPRNESIRRLLAVTYGKAGRLEEAANVCREWLALQPDSSQAQHYLAAVGAASVPERASDAYVVQEFDGFAASFDAKLASLDYRAPQWVGESVARHVVGAACGALQVLDLGCGTGLCGSYLKPYAARLVGVDLSANMLAAATERGLYDALVQAELVAYLEAADLPTQDVVVSADTLCYFGRLEAVFAGVRRVLSGGGLWVFTVEAHQDEAPYVLQVHGRYCHARAYVESQLLANGFCNLDVRDVELRKEGDEPVAGWVIAATAA